ncbi:outer membrane lipoprotein-sorting protein [Microbulbifer sp. ZKSA006]|uniref:outer membrane lipoprotein-sorting protein n=1 Tax=Microbulbifer sp. ZKSA006 TaxID=3243390 RepID=UPI004039A2AF
MCKLKVYKNSLLVGLLLIFAPFVSAEVMASESKHEFSSVQIESMLAKADSYRLGEAFAKVVTNIQVYKKGRLDSEDYYHVYTRPERKSLVVFKGAGQEGQKMLMLQDNYWLLMPRSRRPIRITPMQRLLGGASIGDVATLTWSQDYRGQFVASEFLQDKLAHKLQLQAKTKGASYQKITLWLDAESHFPVRAELYLKSGKLAKVAHFVPGLRDQMLFVEEMVLVDSIEAATETRVRYESSTAHQLPEKFYNPAYLSRQSKMDL